MENSLNVLEIDTAVDMFTNEQTDFFEQTFTPGGDDDDENNEEDEDKDKGNASNDDNPPIDDEVVHSPLPTQTGGKPR